MSGRTGVNEIETAARKEAETISDLKDFALDPWWAIRRGYVFTEDEHAKPGEDSRKPFPPHPYLEGIVAIYQKSPVGIIMKSRQLMLTWLFCWLLLHRAITTAGALCVAQGKREEDVLAKGTKALMGRIRFMRKNLPAHLQPVIAEEESKSTEVYAHDGNKTSAILAVPQGADIIRSLTATDVFMDELAFHPEGEAAWTAALPTIRGGGRLWGVTTPNGREFCYKQADERMPWDEWERWPRARTGLYGYQNAGGIQLIALHYTADQEKRTPEYQQELRKGYTNAKFYRQENELDFSLQPGDAVYSNEFNENLHILKEAYKVDPNAPIYRGWDFGYNGQAVSFFQHNKRGQLVWFDQVFLQRVALPTVCQEVLKRTLLHLGRSVSEDLKVDVEKPLLDLEGNVIEMARYSERRLQAGTALVFDYGDPSAEAKNTEGKTDRETLATFGIDLRTKPTTNRKRDLVENIRTLLLPRSDGSPALLVADGPAVEMRYIIEGFKGGYHYPEHHAGRADKHLPQKDGFYDHMFDCAQYAVDWVRPIRPAIIDEDGGGDSWRAPEWKDNPLTGEIEAEGPVH